MTCGRCIEGISTHIAHGDHVVECEEIDGVDVHYLFFN